MNSLTSVRGGDWLLTSWVPMVCLLVAGTQQLALRGYFQIATSDRDAARWPRESQRLIQACISAG